MTVADSDAEEVRIHAVSAAASASAAWKAVAEAATVPALRRAAEFAVRCQEHAVHAVTWAATAREYAGVPAMAARLARARAAARREATEAEAMQRAAEAAAHGRRGSHAPPARKRPRDGD